MTAGREGGGGGVEQFEWSLEATLLPFCYFRSTMISKIEPNLSQIEQALAGLPQVFDRLSSDFRDACLSWAIWEAGNGYPVGSRRKNLRDSANLANEGHHIKAIQNLAFVSTLLSLCRMMDSVGGNHGADRMSLGRVALTVQNTELLPFLLGNLNASGYCMHTHVSASQTQEYLKSLHVLLGEDVSRRKNLGNLRRNLKELRDNWLAHSLNDAAPSKVTAALVRDGMVFCAITIRRGWLALCGTNWRPKDSWKRSLKDAQLFWDRHEKGFT